MIQKPTYVYDRMSYYFSSVMFEYIMDDYGNSILSASEEGGFFHYVISEEI